MSEGPHVESENGPSAHDDVYGPRPQAAEEKLLSEETKPTLSGPHSTLGKLPAATHILNSILNNYDHKLRPGIGEKPTVVTVELSVNTLGPISILDMEYTIDITFCQTWYDERLRYNGSFESFVLNGNMVSQLWIPDTFFRNSKRTQEHVITMPNQMVRIHKDGKVLYTIRMTIDAGCLLHMLKFPMDSHSCPLSFSSFSYPESEMIYKWEDFKLEINEKNSWKLFQFDFTGVTNITETVSTPTGDFMVMTLFFNVSRRFGFIAFQNYVPSSVTTMLSWVSFWIKKDSAPARTSLGITSVLTMTTLGTFSRKNFPRVSYITALDFYIAICFVFCFCALMEFAVLNFLTYNRTKPRASPKLRHIFMPVPLCLPVPVPISILMLLCARLRTLMRVMERRAHLAQPSSLSAQVASRILAVAASGARSMSVWSPGVRAVSGSRAASSSTFTAWITTRELFSQ
ncbi:gamma-aminobutyric acid receptor subunit epsilon isoform X2 [Panthera tigris]|uniref:gamma-aminobutyric acid receptor subunit epsilon isoform X2 n=1 Tax=Panthera tigris TaxID=9694 RepID=UPI001C6F731C|nr:gamma-aminobutyric acid receptor subunit epsilon isoform X2 [Panthera tigris]